jgi:RHS repeat-associated protein
MTALDDLTWTFDYDSASRRTKLTYPDGMYTNYSYDDVDWVSLMESKTSNHALLESFEYGYDSVGNRVNVTYDNGTAVEYAYDDVYRLVSEDYSWGSTINYTYDGTGNRLTEVRNGATFSYTYDEEDHLLSRGNVTYEWDDNGNLVKKVEWIGNTTYEWNYEGDLTGIILPNGTSLEYTYSPRNTLASESVNNQTIFLFYDFYDLTGRFGDVIGEYNATGQRISSFVHGPGIDEPLAVIKESDTDYFLHDALGSTTALATTSGISEIYRYESFGRLYSGLDAPERYGFTSREVDPLADFYQFRARWYNPEAGRFVSKDSHIQSDYPNPYIYVRNNPANLVDPSGNQPEIDYSWDGKKGWWGDTPHGDHGTTGDDDYGPPCPGMDLFEIAIGICERMGAVLIQCLVLFCLDPVGEWDCNKCCQGSPAVTCAYDSGSSPGWGTPGPPLLPGQAVEI